MEDREQWLKVNVLSSFADDYEDFDMILATVAEWAEKDGMAFSRSEIIEVLSSVINKGYAQAYKLSSRQPYSQPVSFSPDIIDELYFYVTERGKQFVLESSRNLD